MDFLSGGSVARVQKIFSAYSLPSLAILLLSYWEGMIDKTEVLG